MTDTEMSSGSGEVQDLKKKKKGEGLVPTKGKAEIEWQTQEDCGL